MNQVYGKINFLIFTYVKNILILLTQKKIIIVVIYKTVTNTQYF